jgi:glyoxylase-like metal-dependent hydrolase (beta-lactamase superfamily II)
MQENGSITPKEVKTKLRNGDTDFLIVDIRDEEEYRDWNINGSINVPVNSFVARGLVDEIRKELNVLPKDKQIITICTRGVNSQVAARMLREMDYNALHLEKGMKGWNENYDLYDIDIGSKDVRLTQFVRIGKGCLSYIAWSETTKESAVFDPSIFLAEYEQFIIENGLKPKFVIDTHSHADHFSGAMGLSKTFGVPYYINKIDVDNDFSYSSLENVTELVLGKSIITVLATPGHTDGSLSFIVNGKALICGDLLLLESVGRPDLARSKNETIRGAEMLHSTLNNVIFKLDDTVKILPAHFVSTSLRPVSMTLGELKTHNKSLLITDKNEFVKYITESMPQTPPNYESIKKYNKKGIIIPLDYAEDLEIGPNRCASRN